LRAILHFHFKEEGKALDDLTAYLAAGRPLDARSAEACAARGHLVLKLLDDLLAGDLPAARALALEEFRKAVAQGARSVSLFDDYGELLGKMGMPEEAI